MQKMSRPIILGLLIVLTQTVGCVVYPYHAEVDFHDTQSFDGVKKVAVETRNGAIEVRCDAQRKDVEIQAVKYANGLTQEDARRYAESLQVEIGRDAGDQGTLRISAKTPTAERSRSQGVRFKITLPPDAELSLDSSNGALTAEGCARDVNAHTSNGRINVSNCKGCLAARTSNGGIIAHDIQGDVNVETCNGAIEMERVGRKSLRAETSNGRIRVVDGSGAGEVRTTNGSVELRYKSVPANPQIRVVTSNGHVDIELPASVGADLNARTSNGRVHADLHNVRLADFESGRSAVRARLNDGGGNIDIRSTNGSITLRTTGEAAPATPPATKS